MKYKWLIEGNNNKLILFFNGWGMDAEVVKHLDGEDSDVIMFYDYNTIDTDFDFSLLEKFSQVNLIAWSMGVMVATIFADKFSNLADSVAINGTLKPIDKEFGINPRVYDLTIRGFSLESRKSFVKSMFLEPVDLILNRDLENQKSELIALKKYKANENFKYNKVLISSNDKIIPTQSQIAYWNQESNITGGHCPFLSLKSWSELL